MPTRICGTWASTPEDIQWAIMRGLYGDRAEDVTEQTPLVDIHALCSCILVISRYHPMMVDKVIEYLSEDLRRADTLTRLMRVIQKTRSIAPRSMFMIPCPVWCHDTFIGWEVVELNNIDTVSERRVISRDRTVTFETACEEVMLHNALAVM